jgi:hypothetical protein
LLKRPRTAARGRVRYRMARPGGVGERASCRVGVVEVVDPDAVSCTKEGDCLGRYRVTAV